MFFEAQPALEFVRSDDVVTTMESVAAFSFKHGLLGEGAPSSEFIGIAYPGGKVFGSADNVKLRFDDTYMNKAASGEL